RRAGWRWENPPHGRWRQSLVKPARLRPWNRLISKQLGRGPISERTVNIGGLELTTSPQDRSPRRASTTCRADVSRRSLGEGGSLGEVGRCDPTSPNRLGGPTGCH